MTQITFACRNVCSILVLRRIGYGGQWGIKMDDCKRTFVKERDYRIAAGLFDSAFEACERLSSDDQQSLLRKIEKHCSRHPTTTQPKQYKTVEIIGIEIKQSL